MYNEIIKVMKKLKILRAFMVVLVAFAALSLTSCNDDNYESIPVNKEDVNGNYKGKLIMQQGSKGEVIEKNIDFSAKDTAIIFKDFPIEKIVRSVVKDSVKAEEALAAIGKVEYKLHYVSQVNNTNNTVELTFNPKKLEIRIPADGGIGIDRRVEVTLIAKQKGLFIGQDRSLRFGLVAEKIFVDGVEQLPFYNIKYDIPYSIKN